MMRPEIFQAIYDKANEQVRARCDECDSRRNYVCPTHLGWADGFETCLDLFEIARLARIPLNDYERPRVQSADEIINET
jgi:hypothetical protein